MSTESDAVEIYRRHRPRTLDGVVGQDAAVKIIRGFAKDIPAAILFFGWTGTGKTTMARIVARMLGTDPDNRFDYHEKNCAAAESPLGMIQEIQANLSMSPVSSKYTVYVLDEVQSLSRATFAQQALLKILEDTPPHVRFMLCTTDPKKVLPAVRGRCTPIETKAISNKALTDLIIRVAKAEEVRPPVSAELAERLAAAANGSAREALVQLGKVMGIADPDERLAAVGAFVEDEDKFGIVKALLPWGNKSPNWAETARLLEEFKDEDPEGIRLMILASARAQLLKTKSQLAYKAICCLNEPFYDKTAGKALLAAACYEICFGGK